MSSPDVILQLCRLLSLERSEGEIDTLREDIIKGLIEWDGIIAVSNTNLLTPALYDALKRKNLLECIGDTTLKEFLYVVYHRNDSRNKGIVNQIEDIQNTLSSSGIVPLVLKGGAVLTENLYASFGVRVMNDLDIMIEPQRFEEALSLLEQSGYESFGRVFDHWHHHAPRMSKEGYPAAIEPHFRVIFDRNIEYIPYDSQTSTSSNNPKFPNIRVLKPQWHLFHVFLHSAIIDRNYQRWELALRYVYDFSILVQKYRDQIDWESFHQYLFEYRFDKAFEVYLYLAEVLFGVQSPLEVDRWKGKWFLKKALWQSTLVPETKLYKLYEAYVNFNEIYGFEKLKRYYDFNSRALYPFFFFKYALYHIKKHIFE